MTATTNASETACCRGSWKGVTPGVANALVVEHATADDLLADAAVAVGAEQQPDVGDDAAVVDADRDRVDVEDRQSVTGVVEVLAAQPRTRRVHFGHDVILPNACPEPGRGPSAARRGSPERPDPRPEDGPRAGELSPVHDGGHVGRRVVCRIRHAAEADGGDADPLERHV